MIDRIHPTAAPDDIGRLLREHFLFAADDSPVSGQIETIVAGVTVSRPRPGWLVALRGGTIASGAGRALPLRALIILATITLTVLAIAAAIVAGRSAPLKTGDPDGSSYQAVFLTGLDDADIGAVEPGRREIQVIVTRPDGMERVVARIPAWFLPEAMPRPEGVGIISQDGWLALRIRGADGHAWAFVDLRAPDRTPSVVEIPWWGGYPSAALGSWGPPGHFVASASEYHDVMWDFDVGSASASPLEDGAHAIQDVAEFRDASHVPSGGRVYWAFASAFVGWLVPGRAPDERGVLFQSLGPRRLRADGTALDVCLPYGPPCVRADLRPGTITTISADGTLADLDLGRSMPGCAIDASFDAGGTSTWVLRQTAGSEASVILAHVERGGEITSRTELAVSGVDVNTTPPVGIVGIAPDDSMIAFTSPVGYRLETIVVPTNGDRLAPISRLGRFAGFLPSAVADALPGGSFADPPPSREGLRPARPVGSDPTAASLPGTSAFRDCAEAAVQDP